METKPEERSMAADLLKDKWITALMVLVQFVMVFLITLIIMVFVGRLNLGSALFSLTMSSLIWAYVLYKTPVFNWFFINVKPNWAVILGSQLTYDKIKEDPKERTRMNNLKSLREVGSGIRGKFPWEVAFESIDLRSEIIIGSKDKPLECYADGKIGLEITWQVVLTPLRGFLTNLVRKNEDSMQAYFKGACEEFIIEWISKKPEAEVFDALDNLKEEFKLLFGGPDNVSDDEKDYGVFTNLPQITRVTRSRKYQQAAEAEAVAVKMDKVIETIKARLPEETDPNMILAIAAAMTGNEVNGLLLIPGLTGIDPQTMTGLLAASKSAGVQATGTKKGSK